MILFYLSEKSISYHVTWPKRQFQKNQKPNKTKNQTTTKKNTSDHDEQRAGLSNFVSRYFMYLNANMRVVC